MGGGRGGYIRNNIFFSKSDCQSVSKWMSLYPGDLRPGGALTWDFTVCWMPFLIWNTWQHIAWISAEQAELFD